MSDHSPQTNPIKNAKELADRIKTLDRDEADLSSDEDLSVAVMNLVSIEEHFFFTGAKTQKPEYFDLLKEVREQRKELLAKMVKKPEGEVWCISKHLLAASMRLMEVGAKKQGRDQKEEAQELFEKAYHLYSLFWGLNLGLIETGEIKEIDSQAVFKHPDQNGSFMEKLGALVKRAVNCCIE